MPKTSQFVMHPIFGDKPYVTGLNPVQDREGETFFHWHSPQENRIPYTAIKADLKKQTASTIPVTHYFDVKRICRECNKPFIFFAKEQQYWYEELGFKLDSNCVRCCQCRKKFRKHNRIK